MNIEKVREEFEVWSVEHEFLGCCVADRIGNGKYRDFDLQCAWETWQASRATIEVELPAGKSIHERMTGIPSAEGVPLLIDREATASSIAAIGLKVKQP